MKTTKPSGLQHEDMDSSGWRRLEAEDVPRDPGTTDGFYHFRTADNQNGLGFVLLQQGDSSPS